MTSPSPFQPPRLVLVELAPGTEVEGLRVGDALPLPPQVQGRWIAVGAGADQDLVIRERPPAMGRSVARLTRRGGSYVIQGRVTPAGYALNGERFNDCTARPLRTGDRITFGPNVTFEFQLPAEES